MGPGSNAALRPRATDIYGEGVALAREIYKTLQPGEKAPAALPWPENVVQKMLDLFRSGDHELLAYADRSVSDHFLFAHVVNVAILSLRLGLARDLGEEDLLTLGVAAVLHDMGLAAHLTLTGRPTRLTEDEARELKTHVEEGRRMLDLFPIPEGEIKNTIRRVIGEVKERGAGEGYPQGLKKDDIHLFAKIIGLAEAYEAMTHLRPWRPRTLPHEALRTLLEEESGFDADLLKALVEVLSLYPPGSFVRLNTGELARVTAAQPGLPLRPRVWVMVNPDGRRAEPGQIISLAARPDLYITDVLDETTIKTSDPKLALALKAQRWWVKGL